MIAGDVITVGDLDELFAPVREALDKERDRFTELQRESPYELNPAAYGVFTDLAYELMEDVKAQALPQFIVRRVDADGFLHLVPVAKHVSPLCLKYFKGMGVKSQELGNKFLLMGCHIK